MADSVPAGWRSLVEALAARMAELGPAVEIVEVEERYGRLQVVLPGRCDPRVAALVREAEAASVGVCQCCGSSGALCVTQNERGYFLATLCPDHQVTSLAPFADVYEEVEDQLEVGQLLALSDPRLSRQDPRLSRSIQLLRAAPTSRRRSS